MANVTNIATIRQKAAYLGPDVEKAVNAVLSALPPAYHIADALSLYESSTLTTTKAEVDDDAGCVPLMAVVQSTGSSAHLQLFNVDADSVTVGTTIPNHQVAVGATSGETAVHVFMGNGHRTFWDTGFTVAVSSTSGTSVAATNLPKVLILYHAA